MKSIMTGLVAGAALALTVAAASAQQGSTLAQVKQRGVLNCGANTGLAGFGVPDAQGNWSGLDVDYCRAVAAAIFDDPTKVRFVPLTAQARFTALQSGEVDLLVRNSTWTMTRDTTLGITFVATNYYDGQGFMVRKSLGVTSALKLEGAQVCTQQGTTTELNLADFFRKNNLKYTPVTFATADETRSAYEAGRCDAFTTDASGLYSERLKLTKVDDHIILPEVISKEPLASAVRANGDTQWVNIVKWTHYAMLNAEELGVSRANIAQSMQSTNPEIRRLLGVEAKLGEGLGLTNDWAARIIRHVGNYSESFERNIAEKSAQTMSARQRRALFCAVPEGRLVAPACELRQHDGQVDTDPDHASVWCGRITGRMAEQQPEK
ncbi:MAG: amino acid ABC transporter substrate-binding protein [Hyphomicrobiales bacterium]|nr:amino acid ABC transporter substrate-binding protein [Hyphomicrobiales bacterium]